MSLFDDKTQSIFSAFTSKLAQVDISQSVALAPAAEVSAGMTQRAIAEQQIRARVDRGGAAISEALYRMHDSLDFLMNEVFRPSFRAQRTSRSQPRNPASSVVSPLTSAVATSTVALSRGFVNVRESVASSLERLRPQEAPAQTDRYDNHREEFDESPSYAPRP
jgi:hypothetical protein